MTTKTKAHTKYLLKSGEQVPGVTTALGILEKIGLHYWIAEVTRKGEDWVKIRDAAGNIGTLVHSMILADLKGETLDTCDYSKNQIDKAETCLIKYYDWKKKYNMEIMFCEQPLVSEIFKCGGTPDLAAIIDDVPTLIDFKSGRNIYEEYWYQLAAYTQLLLERNFIPQRYGIVRIGTDEKEDFEEQWRNNLEREWEIFQACLSIYELRKRIKEER